MQKIIKNKIFVGTLCLILAGVFSFILLPKFYEAKSAVTNVVVLKEDIDKGSEITNEMLISKEVGSFGLSNNVVVNKDEILGKISMAKMYADEYLNQQNFVSIDKYKENVSVLENGKVLLTLKLPTTSSGVAGVLKGGALVDCYEINESLETNKVLSNICVKEVLNAKLQNLQQLDKNYTLEDNVDLIAQYIVVMVDENEARKLITLEKSESFHLTLVKELAQ